MQPESRPIAAPDGQLAQPSAQPAKWDCTDPDSLQFCRLVRDSVWEFKEFDRFNYPNEFKLLEACYSRHPDTFQLMPHFWDAHHVWMSGMIDLNQASAASLEDTLSHDYDEAEVKRLMESPDPDDMGLVAECIWEDSTDRY